MLGKDHPHTLHSTIGVGISLQNQGRNGEAEVYFRRHLEGVQTLGRGRAYVKRTVRFLIICLRAQGSYEVDQLLVGYVIAEQGLISGDKTNSY